MTPNQFFAHLIVQKHYVHILHEYKKVRLSINFTPKAAYYTCREKLNISPIVVAVLTIKEYKP